MTRNNPQKQNQPKPQDRQNRPGQQGQGQGPSTPGRQQGQGNDQNRKDPTRKVTSPARSDQSNSKDDERGQPGTQRPGQGGTDRS